MDEERKVVKYNWLRNLYLTEIEESFLEQPIPQNRLINQNNWENQMIVRIWVDFPGWQN